MPYVIELDGGAKWYRRGETGPVTYLKEDATRFTTYKAAVAVINQASLYFMYICNVKKVSS